MIIVRCDDISVDTDVDALKRIWELVHEFPVTHIIAVTPKGRGDPIHHMKPLKRGNAWIQAATGDDYIFSNKDLLEVIWLYQSLGAKIAIHGLIHIDYRKLSYREQLYHLREAQEIMDTFFSKVKYFVPPFNKYNDDTVEICSKLDLELVPNYYEADTKIANNNPQPIEVVITEACKAGNFAYHPYWLQGGWEEDRQIINGQRFNIEEAQWSLDDSLPALRQLLKGVGI